MSTSQAIGACCFQRVALAASLASLGGLLPPAPAAETAGMHAALVAPHSSLRDYGHLYWQQGLRTQSPDRRNILCFQTGWYGFAIDVQNLDVVRLGTMSEEVSYDESIGHDMLAALPAGKLVLEVTANGKIYRCNEAVHPLKWVAAPPAEPGGVLEDNWVKGWNNRIIEYGRYCQRVDLDRLVYRADDGSVLAARAKLNIESWPDTLRLRLDLIPEATLQNVQASVAVLVQGNERHTTSEKRGLACNELLQVALPLHFAGSTDTPVIQVLENGTPLPVSVDPEMGVCKVLLPARQWPTGEPANLDRLDSYHLRIENPSDQLLTCRLVFALEGTYSGEMGAFVHLRDERGNPIGVTLQNSRLWGPIEHNRKACPDLEPWPTYLPADHDRWYRAATVVHIQPHSCWEGRSDVSYARWGGIPKASFYQLNLFDWGSYTHWDVSILGAWGESLCFGIDSFAQSDICDVRPLYVRSNPNRSPVWEWTPNVGGGNYLYLVDPKTHQRQYPVARWITESYGPNLVDSRYTGTIADGRISYNVRYLLPRTDDINRSIHQIHYAVLEDTPFADLALMQLGAPLYDCNSPRSRAWGSGAGLTKEESDYEMGEVGKFTAPVQFSGAAPWWVSLHHSSLPQEPGKPQPLGNASRGLIIREFAALIGGRRITTPSLRFRQTRHQLPSIIAELVLPDEVKTLHRGDCVDFTVELVLIPVNPAEYMGTNEAFRRSLPGTADTWKAVDRQARMNVVSTTVMRGQLVESYPLHIAVDTSEAAEFETRGGLAYMPIIVSGLRSHAGYSLYEKIGGQERKIDQSVHGNDYWQTDYEPRTSRYRRVYNVLVDGSDDLPSAHHYVLRKDGEGR